MSTIIAGLPQNVVLKSTTNGHYLQYLWNDEFGEFYKCMGTNRVVDPVSPFVQLEVVPSATDPSLVHLRSSYSNKFFHLVKIDGLAIVMATADEAVENRNQDTCTLFQPVITAGANTVKLISLRNTEGGPVRIFHNPEYPDKINGVACIYPDHRFTEFEFTPWVSYEDEKAAKEKEIQELKDQAAVDAVEIQKLKDQVAADAVEIQKLKDQVASDATEIQELKDQVADRDAAIQKLGDEVAALKAREEEIKAKLAEAESELEVQVAAAWKAFKASIPHD